MKVDYLFFDDNTDSHSSFILNEFASTEQNIKILSVSQEQDEVYQCDEYMHHWRESIIWKVAGMKDRILEIAREELYSHVFFADSDLIFHPETLKVLLHTDKDLVSTVFWTKWQPETIEMPQVWLHGEYDHYPLIRQNAQDNEQKAIQAQRFFFKLRKPGLYEVGGLGACTLISRSALFKGVSFAEIKNLNYWGEDRHFCVRAAALGLSMFVETSRPAYHIYRESELAGVERYYESCLRGPDEASAAPPTESINHFYQQAMELLSYGYEAAAMEEFRLYINTGAGVTENRVRVILELDAYYGRCGLVQQGRVILLEAVKTLSRAELYCRLGSKSMDLESWTEAAAWLKAAIALPRPENWEASSVAEAWTWLPYIQLCVCYVKLGENKLAFEYNEKGLSYHPKHPTMLSNRDMLVRMLA
ncbi:glycosyltransferase family 2 protein [Paenibacillus luteus]|uniref:glycosyltransferase family 2 protein n=1 Tax=Paenibacillus luteus TaxID=2545753 RepID=UPI0019D60EE0|nr:hypothetical protein [Paenibacillus luteus]